MTEIKIMNWNVVRCPLYPGNPYLVITEKGYHVMQGKMMIDDIKVWYKTPEQAITSWDKRVFAMLRSEESGADNMDKGGVE